MSSLLFNVKTHAAFFDDNSLYIGRYSRYVPANAPDSLRAALAAGSGILANEFPLPPVHTAAQRQAVIAKKAAALALFFQTTSPQHPSAAGFFTPSDTKVFCWCSPLPCHGSLILFCFDRIAQLNITPNSPSWMQLSTEMRQIAHALLRGPLSIHPSQIPDNPHILSLCEQLGLLSPPQQTLF